MPLYSPQSLELLRQRIDLTEVVGAHITLKRTGASYKALCPFHEEKTPSFMIQKGAAHYHCFGCGAHGDAIGFLMAHVRMGFVEAVEHLAEKFGVVLERAEGPVEAKGPSRVVLKEALEKACRFYHFSLLYSEEGREALTYLYERGIDLAFLKAFEIGYATRQRGALRSLMEKEGVATDVLEAAGLLHMDGGREFFFERIMFPIRDGMGAVIGFSARKFKEETFGGKYINTPETPLFKKSKVLFGLSYSRRRIARERRAIIVEGQIDCLRMIQAGFNCTVAGQGTAFGEGHAKELLSLGVQEVILALDGDDAGREAAMKVGDLFQKKGVEVFVLRLPEGSDPDAVIREQGAEGFLQLVHEKIDYLSFAVEHLQRQFPLDTPSGKNNLVETLTKQISAWEHPVMVHESLKRLAELTHLPEGLIGVRAAPLRSIRRSEGVERIDVDPDRILETDLLRWLLLVGTDAPELERLVQQKLSPDDLRTPTCRRLFASYLMALAEGKPRDLLSLAASLENEEEAIVEEILGRKVNMQKVEEGVREVVKKLLYRGWLAEREKIRLQIQSGGLSEEEVVRLAKEFDTLRKNPPTL
jgi:DNA primase